MAIEHDHRMGAAIERIDIVVLVDADRGDIGIELVAGRQFCPIVDHLEPEAVRSEYHRHGTPSPLGI